jgi:hypothetical protein
MNTNGKDFINALCNRLRDEGKLCTDNQICTLLRSLDSYEVNQIVTFGITDKWKREKLEKVRSLNAI